MKYTLYKFTSVPKIFNYGNLIDAMLGKQFMLYHDIAAGDTYLICEHEAQTRLRNSVAGIELNESQKDLNTLKRQRFVAVYDVRSKEEDEKADEGTPRLFESAYALLNGSTDGFFVSFAPGDSKYAQMALKKIEASMSKSETGLTVGLGKPFLHDSMSMHTESYHDSDKRVLFSSMLGMLNESIAKNGVCYKVGVIIDDSADDVLVSYLKQNVLILDEEKLKAKDLVALIDEVAGLDAMPFSYKAAENLLSFSGHTMKVDIIETQIEKGSDGEIRFGSYLKGSVTHTENAVCTSRETLNLGALITGVPGSGKTRSAMSIISQAAKAGRTKVVILSPTEEWSAFGRGCGFEIVELYRCLPKVNFFSCSAEKNRHRFYENLAMLISSASSAGPYTNSMEKCLLAAFNRICMDENQDPLDIYEEIDETVIERHAKRSNVGIKYTKHGENITAALENVRLMLMKPQFAYKEGVNFEKLAEKGAVFDLSVVSNKMKPFFYALILNQIYNMADAMDTKGDRELRMLICIEEAQLIFGGESASAAKEDLKQRIQDFRKKGIGIILITHSLTEIDLDIRRLCQTKLYFRQSTDSARIATKDLSFPEESMEEVADKLKILAPRQCALGYIVVDDDVKTPRPPIFIDAKAFEIEDSNYSSTAESSVCPDIVETDVRIRNKEGIPMADARVGITYAGETVYRGSTDERGSVKINNTLRNKKYMITVALDKKTKERHSFIGGESKVIVC